MAMRFNLDIEFKDYEDPESGWESGDYYNGYDVYIGGHKAMFYPYDGSSWEEAFETIVEGLGSLLKQHLGFRDPRKDGE